MSAADVTRCDCPLTALASCSDCDLEDVAIPACDHAADRPVCATCRAAALGTP
jgi:hypothetical protein